MRISISDWRSAARAISAVLRLALVAAFASSLLQACGNDTGPDVRPVRIEPERARYSPGETVTLRLVNLGTEDVRFNVCPALLQRLDAAGWVDVPVSGPNCPDIAYALAAGTTATGRAHPLPATLQDGTYRYRVDVLAPSGLPLPVGLRPRFWLGARFSPFVSMVTR
jgi:hypothetical protein